MELFSTELWFGFLDSTAPDITFPSTLPEKTRASPLVTWTSSESSNFECALDDVGKERTASGLETKFLMVHTRCWFIALIK